MKHIFLLGTLVLLTSTAFAGGTCCDNAYAYGKTHFSQRPQGNFYPLLMMATADKTHIVDTDKNYQLFSLTLGYRQNFDRYYQAQYFMNEGGFFTVGPNNTNVDFRSTDMGLVGPSYNDPVPAFEGSTTAQPSIKEFVADFDFYAGFDKWVKGTWFRIHVPVVRSSWNFCLRDATGYNGGDFYPPFFYAPYLQLPPVFTSIWQAVNTSHVQVEQVSVDITAGKIRGEKTRWGVADVHFELGWDFLRNAYGNLGAALIATAPTGLPKPCSKDNEYLFPPSIGAQRCWQLGGALRGQYELFDDAHKTITFYADARIVHLFEGRTKRLMGLNAGNTTRYNQYLMLYPFDENGVQLNNTISLVHAPDILNRTVKVTAAAMGEFTCMLTAAHKSWNGGLGYNFWFRTCERLCLCDKAIASDTQFGRATYFLIKGDRDLFGAVVPPPLVPDLSAYGKSDSNIAKTGTPILKTDPAVVKANSFTDGDINVNIAAHPATYSNMLFGYLSYTFDTKRQPYVAAGANIELGRGNTALNTWGVYLKGGITF